jgi:hypothetical protein
VTPASLSLPGASDSVLARRGLSIGTRLQLEVVQFASRKRRVNQREWSWDGVTVTVTIKGHVTIPSGPRRRGPGGRDAVAGINESSSPSHVASVTYET